MRRLGLRHLARPRRRMLVPVVFRAGHGGLHSNVSAQLAAARRAGWAPTLMCPEGPFAAKMRRRFRVVTHDFADEDEAVETAMGAGPFDLVHAHPWASFRVGAQVATGFGAHLVVTRHNVRIGDLPARSHLVDLVVAVSDLARQAIVVGTDIPRERVVVVPNGIDTRRFRRRHRSRYAGAQPRILVASRFDEDKTFIVELLEETWATMGKERHGWPAMRWTIAGDGTLLPRMRQSVERFLSRDGSIGVEFVGWLEPPALARAMAAASVVIAPGRSALEALATGTTTIAVGGRGYLGLIDGETALTAIAQNFGSSERGWDEYQDGALARDLKRALEGCDDDGRRQRLALAIAAEHDQHVVDARLARLWDLVSALPPRACTGRP